RPLDLSGHGGFGAVEIALRYSGYRADEALFTTPAVTPAAKSFADPEKSARAATSLTAGVNWYLNNNTRLQLDYVRTTFTSGAKDGDRATENALLGRLQVSL